MISARGLSITDATNPDAASASLGRFSQAFFFPDQNFGTAVAERGQFQQERITSRFLEHLTFAASLFPVLPLELGVHFQLHSPLSGF